jgi:hypothetical protein
MLTKQRMALLEMESLLARCPALRPLVGGARVPQELGDLVVASLDSSR